MKKSKLIITIIGIILLLSLIGIFIINHSKTFMVKLMVDNNLYKEVEIKYGKSINEVPIKEGYTFNGWYLNNKLYDNKTKIKANLTLEAKFAITKYLVTFDDDNGNVSSIEVEYNKSVSKPDNPIRSGYTFLGWYLDNNKYNFDSVVTSNLNLKAKWQKINYKQSVNVSDILKLYLGSSDFKSNISNSKVNINIKEVNNKLSNYIDNINKITTNVLSRDDIKEIDVTFNNKTYKINGSNIKEELDNLLKSLTDTSLLDYNERNISSLYNKTMTVKFILNTDYFYAKNNQNKYTITFTSDNIVTNKEMNELSQKSVKYIKMYDVTFNNNTHNIVAKYNYKYNNYLIFALLYENSHDGGGSGTGLNDAVQTFASNQKISKLNIHFKDNTIKSITREEMITAMDNSFKMMSFGDEILKAMGINGTVTSVRHYEFNNKKVTFSLELIPGLAFEDAFKNNYTLTISAK